MTEIPEDDEPSSRNEPPDSKVTVELFREWRAPRFGERNPQRMSNPVWEWLVRSRQNAYSAALYFREPSACKAGPGWCFDRFGQSDTLLADGRRVLVAGEHEDYYDPDFYIYNDVVVLHPDGAVEIFTYPRDVFPPTDFHSATLIGQCLVLIGSLGYPNERQAGTTPVAILDLETFAIHSVVTIGDAPGWIYEHKAELEQDGASILLRNGKVDRADKAGALLENLDEWRLHLADWRWERLTERNWPRWEIRRLDRRHLLLWKFGLATFYREMKMERELQQVVAELTKESGQPPDLALAAKLFSPEISHQFVPPPDGESQVARIVINEVTVRYVQDTSAIQMTIEGELPAVSEKALTADLLQKLSALENVECELVRL